jgi:hypothetical protein
LAFRHVAALAVVALCTCGHAGAQATIPAPTLLKLAAAANSRDAAALRRMTAAGVENDYGWAAAPPGMLTTRRTWQVKSLTLPGVPAGESATLIAFSHYQQAESTGDHLFRAASTADGLGLGPEISENDLLGTRVRRHRFTIRFDVPNRRVALTDHVTIERQSSDFPSILLRINTIYTVSSVKRNGVPLPFRQAGGFLAIQPPGGAEKRVELDLAYGAMADFSNEDFIRPDHAALTGYWYVHTGRMPASSEAQVTVPRGWTAIAQGEPTGKTVAPASTTFGWSNRLPVCYLTVAAGRYTVTSRKVGSVLVSAYLLKPSARRADEAISTAGSALSWFSRNFSPFPYTRYAVVETSVFPAALECYSFTLVASSLVPIAIVHEASHTWWGGVVPNTYTKSLWNESFAEYSDGLYGRMNHKSGLHEFNTKLMSQSGFVTKHSLLDARDAMDMEDSMLGYGKGSLVLENLEKMLGTQRMLACMRNFIGTHVREKPGEDADWPDAVEAFTQAAGSEWKDYFGPWLSSTNLPALRLADVTSRKEGAGYVVEGKIEQQEPARWLQVPLVVRAGGASTTSKVNVKAASQPFRIEVAAKPVSLSLDPQREALRAGARVVASPDLLSYQTLSGKLLAIYATGGDAAETEAAKRAAAQQAKELFPFATVTVKADIDATEAEMADANLLLIGRTESLRIPARLRAALRLQVSDGKIRWSGREWSGMNLWGLELLANPLSPRFLVGHAAAASPAALANLRYQADLDAQKGVFIVRGRGKPVDSFKVEAESGETVVFSP